MDEAGSSVGQSITITGGVTPIATRTGADGRSYTVHTYITWQAITGGRT